MGHRTVLDADAAPGAAVHVNAPGAFPDFDLEIPRGPLDGFEIRIGDQFNIEMPADLDQFG